MDGLKYYEEHEWIKMDGNVATMGITDHAQEALGDIVFVDLPEVGSTIEAKESIGAVESVNLHARQRHGSGGERRARGRTGNGELRRVRKRLDDQA